MLSQDPAVLLRLGWTPAQIQAGDHGRHRHPDGRPVESLPRHPDSRRDAVRRVEAAAWRRVPHAAVGPLDQRRLVRGKVDAIDGSGRGTAFRLVCLDCVSGPRPVIVAGRLLESQAWENGKEAAGTRALSEQGLDLEGPECIDRLLANALSCDGPLLAWLAD
jgi:hypothetical protein